MQKTIGILAILLVAQVVFAVGMSFTGPSLTAVRPDTPLLELAENAVDRLTIEGSDNQQLALSRQGEEWVLPEKGNFPADQTRIDRLLDQLSGLKRGLPVATTKGAQKRFRVSDDAFERRVTLSRGDETLSKLYLGTSPGMRRVHARTSDDDAVYTVDFGVYDAPGNSEDWEDKSVLQISRSEIGKIILAGLTLSLLPGNGSGIASEQAGNQDPGQTTWRGDALAEKETVNQANADALAEELAGLRIGSVLGTDTKPEYGLEEPELVIGLQHKGGEEFEYRLGKHENGHDYVLKSSSRPEYFRLPNYTGDALLEAARREQLVETVSEVSDESETLADLADSIPTESSDVSDQGNASEEGLP